MENADDSRPSLSYRVSGDDVEWEAPDSDEAVAALLRTLAAAPPVTPLALLTWRDPESLVGTTLAHFEVERLLGIGGLGVVYRARDCTLDRAVALKVLAPPARSDGTMRDRVLHEARAAARVNDPAVAAIYEVGEAKGIAFIAMEYVEGETLRALLERGPLPMARVLRLGHELARGLTKAHAQGVVHRDLKPENILIEEGGRAKILDFGIAAECGVQSNQAGTPVYMAPEQGIRALADPRVDVYALGIVLLECIIGSIAADDRSARGLGDRVTRASVLLAAHGCPAPLQRIVERCIRVEPSERFVDGEAVAAAFDALLREEAHRRLRWKRIAAGAIAIAAGIAGLGVGALRRRSAGENAIGGDTTLVDRTRLRRLTANVPERPILGSAVSPDGRTLAFSDAIGLHLTQVGTSEAQAIPFAPGESPQLVRWTDDGRRLVVTVAIDGRDDRDLRVVDVASGAQKVLARGAFSALAVSSEPARIAYAEDDSVGYLALESPEVRHPLTRKGAGCFIADLAWSPSGSRIAYASLCFASLADTTLETIGIDETSPRIVMREPRLFNDMARAGVAWRRSGDVLFSLAEWMPSEPGSNIWSLDVDERTGQPRGERRQLTHWMGVSATSFNSNRAGDRLSFVRYDVQTDIYVAGLTEARTLAGAPTRLTLRERNERAPSWAADGSGVYYSSDENGNFDIYFQDLGGHPPKSIASTHRWETSPIVTPDGSSLLYWQLEPIAPGEGTPTKLVVHSLTGREADRLLAPSLTSHAGGMGRPPPWEARMRCATARAACFVSESDGDDLVFSRVPLEGGASTPIFRYPHATAATNFWDVSSDGAWLAIPVANGPIHLEPIAGDASNASTRDLAMPAGCDPGVLAWSKDQRGIFVSAECAEEPTFRLYDLAIDGETRLVWQDAPNYLLEPEPSPDGRNLAIVVKRPDDDVWLADGL